MMGTESVAYHQATILGRGDDHAGQALAYYASRGETPLVWGGSGAERLGLVGAVTDAQYGAINELLYTYVSEGRTSQLLELQEPIEYVQMALFATQRPVEAD